MSDKIELIAAAIVTATGGDTPSLALTTSRGFKTLSRSSDGLSVLTLDDKHDVNHLAVQVTRKGNVDGSIVADVLDKETVQVSSFDTDGAAADTSFFINVYRVRH